MSARYDFERLNEGVGVLRDGAAVTVFTRSGNIPMTGAQAAQLGEAIGQETNAGNTLLAFGLLAVLSEHEPEEVPEPEPV